MPQSPSGSPPPPSRTPPTQRPAWDAALKPAQARARRGRTRLEQGKLADARQQQLITTWLRELANRQRTRVP
jgi:hypothetical protein